MNRRDLLVRAARLATAATVAPAALLAAPAAPSYVTLVQADAYLGTTPEMALRWYCEQDVRLTYQQSAARHLLGETGA